MERNDGIAIRAEGYTGEGVIEDPRDVCPPTRRADGGLAARQ
jgi:hypothetical protein